MTGPREPPEVPEGHARGVSIGAGPGAREVVYVRRHGVLYAYENRCPHQGTPLETFPDKFLNSDGSMLICSTHGARFRVEDGLCVSGPCKGERLLRVNL
jgi:nitrite reductase/ring-hydroxylating ferredoxin subunit